MYRPSPPRPADWSACRRHRPRHPPLRTTSASGAIHLCGRATGDDAVDLGEGDRPQSRLAMVDLAEERVCRAFERGPASAVTLSAMPGLWPRSRRQAARRGRSRRCAEVETEPPASPRRLHRVEFREEASAVVFAARQIVGRPDAVIGRAAEHGLFDAAGIGGDIFARRVAAARARPSSAGAPVLVLTSSMNAVSSRNWSAIEERLAWTTVSSSKPADR